MADNKIDQKKLKSFIREIERCDEEVLSEFGYYRNKVGAVKERRKGWIEQAVEGGMPKRELMALLKTRKLKAKVDTIFGELDEDQQAIFEQMEFALDGGDDQPKREPKTKGMPGADAPGSVN